MAWWENVLRPFCSLSFSRDVTSYSYINLRPNFKNALDTKADLTNHDLIMDEEESLEKNSSTSPRQSEDRSKKTARKRASPNKQRLIANYDPSQQEKIRRANCLAARECRKRKKLLTQNLEATLESVKNDNQILQGQYDALVRIS